jgi:FADH2 O2-dependent halogenase
MTYDCDLAIVGSGFGGSLLAMIARRLDLRVALVERGAHPRFAIGESASPLAGILIEQLADRYDLPRVRPLSAYGPWQRAYPEIGCGLKRGFTYFRHERGRPYQVLPGRANQLLVAASPSDELSDTHWLRADVDHLLVREAASLGAEYLDRVDLQGIDWQTEGSPVLHGFRKGQTLHVRARFVVDASGPRGFLARTLGIADVGFPHYPRTQALFSHFTGVARCDDMAEYGCEGAEVRGHGGNGVPPYPADDAALHHVFDGGWMWVLRFGNGVTSAGIAVVDDLAADLRLADGEPAWHRFLSRYPSIAAQFAAAEPTRAFTWMPRLAWRAATAAGPGWAMLPSAAAFVDPLFSTGIPLTLLGIERLARLLEGRSLGVGSWGVGVQDAYSNTTLAEADHTARFIAGCYAAFARFGEFTAYSMFYFAAASYSEMARRLGVQPASARFLGADRQPFADETIRLSPASCAAGDDYARDVAAAIDALNIAGLCDPSKRNWYGVNPDDAIRGAAKLGVSPEAVADALAPFFTNRRDTENTETSISSVRPL